MGDPPPPPMYPSEPEEPEEPEEPTEPEEPPPVIPSSSFGIDWNAIRENHIRQRELQNPRPARPSTPPDPPTYPPSAPQPNDLPDYSAPQSNDLPDYSAPQSNDLPDYSSHVDKSPPATPYIPYDSNAPYNPTVPITSYVPTAPYDPTSSTLENPSTPLLDHNNTVPPGAHTNTYTDLPPSYNDVMDNDISETEPQD